MIVIDILVFWLIYFLSFMIGYFIESNVSPFGLFDVYPWKCRKCLTTWLMVGGYGCGALLLNSWVFFLGGVILAISQAICFIITDKEKGIR